jgi:hypothetical protein
MMDRYLPIAEHGLTGNLRTAALVTTDGTIDWFWCPRSDASACSRRCWTGIAPDHQAAAWRLPSIVQDGGDRCPLRCPPVQRLPIVVPARRLAMSRIQCEAPLASVAVPESRTGTDLSAHDLNSRADR